MLLSGLTTRLKVVTASRSVSMVGAALGGAVAQLFGSQVAFILNAVSYLGSAFFLMRVRGRFNNPGIRVSGASLHSLTEGFRFLKNNPRILAFALGDGEHELDKMNECIPL